MKMILSPVILACNKTVPTHGHQPNNVTAIFVLLSLCNRYYTTQLKCDELQYSKLVLTQNPQEHKTFSVLQ